MALKEKEMLLVEFVEDLATKDEHDCFLLHQLKHVEEAATLRSTHVIKTLIHAVSTFLNNERKSIHYKYVTTAKIGRETGENNDLITIWQELQKEEINANDDRVLAIQKVLKGNLLCW